MALWLVKQIFECCFVDNRDMVDAKNAELDQKSSIIQLPLVWFNLFLCYIFY